MDHLRRPFRGVRWLPAAALAFLSAANGFPVAAASSLISIAPNSGVQGQTVPSVTITGANTHFTNGSIIDLGAGITASKISAKDATHLAAQLTIAGTAATYVRRRR
jgi:hypothetical protein